jgi:hypothetical protein
LTLILRELVIPHTTFLQDVTDLADLDMELLPDLFVKLDEVGLVSLQRNNKKGADLGVRSAVEELEVALGEELHVIRDLVMVSLSAEDVLFLQGIAFTKGVDEITEDIHVGHIEIGVRGILLDGVLDLDDDGTIAFLLENRTVFRRLPFASLMSSSSANRPSILLLFLPIITFFVLCANARKGCCR